jgi:hypothetical protein
MTALLPSFSIKSDRPKEEPTESPSADLWEVIRMFDAAKISASISW